MMNEAMDRAFLENGVVFLPWIGKNYGQGFNDRRLLILGESHYDEWNGEKHKLANTITRECIQEVINRDDSANFWKYLEQALLNEPRQDGWAPNGGSPLWDKVAFYNFVQSPVPGGPRQRPGWEAFEESRKPFREILEKLRPERVLVCGKGLSECMEAIEENDNYLHDDVQAYRLDDGTKVWCLATNHPSSGSYSWRNIHPIILYFLKEPQIAAESLRRR